MLRGHNLQTLIKFVPFKNYCDGSLDSMYCLIF